MRHPQSSKKEETRYQKFQNASHLLVAIIFILLHRPTSSAILSPHKNIHTNIHMHICTYSHVASVITLPAGSVAKYCNEHVRLCVRACVSIYLSVRLSARYLPDHTCDLYQLFCACCLSPGSVLLWQGDEIPRERGNFGGFLPHSKALSIFAAAIAAASRWRLLQKGSFNCQ